MIEFEKLEEEIKKLRHPRGFLLAGIPHFNKLFGRDSIVSSWQLLDYDSNIAKSTLEVLSEFQGTKIDYLAEEEPGKILHEHIIGKKKHPKRNWPFPYYGSIDATLLYLILFYFYYQKAKDKYFLEKYWLNIERAIDWIFNYGDKDNDLYIEYQKTNPQGLNNQGWKDSDGLKIKPPVSIVEVQGYQYFALIKIAELGEVLNKNVRWINKLKERATLLKEKFNQEFWVEEQKFFALAFDGEKNLIKKITSNQGHLLFTEIIEEDKIDYVVKKFFQDDLWTSYGIRTHSTLEPDFDPLSYHLGSIWPHDNWIIAQGLKKFGYSNEFDKVKNALFKAYEKLGYLPEYYAVVDNKIIAKGLKEKEPDYPQAWSTGALINFLLEK
jgi:glycogen debranching enzyme